MAKEAASNTLSHADTDALKIRAAQVTILYKQAATASFTSIVVACLLAVMQWHVIAQDTIIIWLALMFVATSVRFISFALFFKVKPDVYKIHVWEKAQFFITVLAGSAWGSAGVLMFPQASFEYQAGTLVVLTGMAAGAVTTLSALRKPVATFLLLVLVPMTANFFLTGSDTAFLIGILLLMYITFLMISANQSYSINLENISMRIRSDASKQKLRISEQFSKETNAILEMMAKGEGARRIYDAITSLYESRHGGIRCSLLELRGNQLLHGSAPSMPEQYCKDLNGLIIGPDVGSCGTAVFTGKMVLVEDVATDPKWATVKDVVLGYGIRSAWSKPVLDSSGKVLGSFCMYGEAPGLPNEEQLADMESAAHLASIVLEREQRDVSLRKFSRAIEQAGEAILITDVRGMIEYINPAFTKLSGYTEEDLLGKTPRELKSGFQSEAYYQELWGTITSGKVWTGSIIDRRKDGSSYPAMMSIAPILNDQGEITNFVSIQQDMTEHQALENQFRQAQKMEALGTLVGGIAHDFNNILAGMTGNLYLAKKNTEDRPDVQRKLSNVEDLSFRAADLIQQLLTFALRDMVTMKPLPLATFIKEPLKLMRTTIPENIKLRRDVCTDSLLINGDATQLQQALINLVNNARDALEGIDNPTITVRLNTVEVDSKFLENHPYFLKGVYAHLQVQDNGCGIPSEHLDHLFEPFFTTKEQGKGTGLGLAMVFGAIKTHQGYIEVESKEGEGSAFHLYIPLLAQAFQPAASKAEMPIVNGNGEVVLLVDDEAHIRATGKEVLESLGYEVLLAKDGQEAVDIYSKSFKRIKVVVMDVVMPKLGGVEAAHQIMALNPNVKVIFASGYDIEEALPENVLSSEVPVLAKPYDVKLLSKEIASAISAAEKEVVTNWSI